MKKILTFAFMMLLLSVSSCSKDDEPGTPTPDGVSDYINAVQMLYADEEPAFTSTGTPGQYVASADSAEFAHEWIERLIGKSWDGKAVTVNFDEKSFIRLEAETQALLNQGIYDVLSVNFPGYPAFTLTIIDEARASDDNDGYGGIGVVTKLTFNNK